MIFNVVQLLWFFDAPAALIAIIFMFKNRLTTKVLLVAVPAIAFWANTYYKTSQIQKSHNSIFRGIIFFLNNNKEALELVGPCKHDGMPVKGNVNIIKGIADIEFNVEGLDGPALVRFKGNRLKNKDSWESDTFTVQKGSQIINL